jgi:hypothetical protein
LDFEPYSLASAVNGHACFDFQPGSDWLIFATRQHERLELPDDCDGAVPVSSLLGATMEGAGVAAQMEVDFIAGLADPNPRARLTSVQRLGGLRSPSARPALQRVIEQGSPVEAKWAVYASLRTGDTTVLPLVRDYLMKDGPEEPGWMVPFELSLLKEPAALPGLIEIANTAYRPNARAFAILAIGRNFHAMEAVAMMAGHLTDPNSAVRYQALSGLGTLTGEPACTLPLSRDNTEPPLEPQIQRCLTWWQQSGRLRFPQR